MCWSSVSLATLLCMFVWVSCFSLDFRQLLSVCEGNTSVHMFTWTLYTCSSHCVQKQKLATWAYLSHISHLIHISKCFLQSHPEFSSCILILQSHPEHRLPVASSCLLSFQFSVELISNLKLFSKSPEKVTAKLFRHSAHRLYRPVTSSYESKHCA